MREKTCQPIFQKNLFFLSVSFVKFFSKSSCISLPFVLCLPCKQNMVILRGRVQFPTGGDSPRPVALQRLTWCNSMTDGDSPDERRKKCCTDRFILFCFLLPYFGIFCPLVFLTKGFFIAGGAADHSFCRTQKKNLRAKTNGGNET